MGSGSIPTGRLSAAPVTAGPAAGALRRLLPSKAPRRHLLQQPYSITANHWSAPSQCIQHSSFDGSGPAVLPAVTEAQPPAAGGPDQCRAGNRFASEAAARAGVRQPCIRRAGGFKAATAHETLWTAPGMMHVHLQLQLHVLSRMQPTCTHAANNPTAQQQQRISAGRVQACRRGPAARAGAPARLCGVHQRRTAGRAAHCMCAKSAKG